MEEETEARLLLPSPESVLTSTGRLLSSLKPPSWDAQSSYFFSFGALSVSCGSFSEVFAAFPEYFGSYSENVADFSFS